MASNRNLPAARTRAGQQDHPSRRQSLPALQVPRPPSDAENVPPDPLGNCARPDRQTAAGAAAAGDGEVAAIPSGPPLVLTLPEAAATLRLERRFLDRAIAQKQVRVVYFGRAKRIPYSEVERLAAEGLPAPARPRQKDRK